MRRLRNEVVFRAAYIRGGDVDRQEITEGVRARLSRARVRKLRVEKVVLSGRLSNHDFRMGLQAFHQEK